ENVEGHEHQGAPERFRAPTEQAASMFADLVDRDRRDLSAHITAERAAHAARQDATNRRGPELADEFEEAAQFTPAARARTDRAARAEQARNAPDPTAEQPQAVGQNTAAAPEQQRGQGSDTPARLTEQPTGQGVSDPDMTGPISVQGVQTAAPVERVRVKLPTIPERDDQANDLAHLEAGWEAVESYRGLVHQAENARDPEGWRRAAGQKAAAFTETYGASPEQWAAEHPQHEVSMRKTRQALDDMREARGLPPAVRASDPVPVNFPDRHFEQLTDHQRAQLWAHREHPDMADTARRVYETAHAHHPDLAHRDAELKEAGPAAWRRALTDLEDGKIVPPIDWVRNPSIVEKVTADRAKSWREDMPKPKPEISNEARRAMDAASHGMPGTPQQRMAKIAQDIRKLNAEKNRDQEYQERQRRDYGYGGPDRGRGGPSIGR
ncbi:hypothetical protein, partial [Arthrobacter sp.]|uniref:hypothetical protein n=1 Tax=Arthrobacter sp. TaxID=1667 RepID=UPI00258354E0